MITFKKWLQIENLAGPGGGPEPSPENQELLAKDNNVHGVGAFGSYGSDDPPEGVKTPTDNYADPRFGRKFMSRDEKKSRLKRFRQMRAGR